MKSESEIRSYVLKHRRPYFQGEYMYSFSYCEKCQTDFVLQQHDNPSYDDARVLEFPHICDSCL